MTVISFSQSQLSPGPKFINGPKINLQDLKIDNKSNLNSKTATMNSGWFNYGMAAQNAYAQASYAVSSYLFPDTMAYAEFGLGNFEPIWVHHITELVDLRSPVFAVDPGTSWIPSNPLTPIKIDSIALYCAYTRNHPNPSIVDTLIITVYDNSTPTNLELQAFTGVTAGNYGTDTLSYQRIGYNQPGDYIAAPSATNTTQLAPSGQYQFKVLLTTTDSTAISYKDKHYALPTPFYSTVGNLIVADVMFKPGYTYTLTQQIDATANAFLFVSVEENGDGGGAGTFMNHTDCNFGSSSCDYSMSYLVPKQVRYNQLPNWNSRSIPAAAYSMAFAYEHHMISFHISDTSVVNCQVNSQFSISPDTLNPGTYNAYNNSTGSGTLSYLWDFGDNTTSTQPYPLHQYAVPGQYVVCLTVLSTAGTNTCSSIYCDSSSVQKMASGFLMSQFNVLDPQLVTGIQKPEINFEITAYPNPIEEELIIEIKKPLSKIVNYTLTDALGRTVLSNSIEQNKTAINTSQLRKGFYTLTILNDKGSALKTLKLIK